MSIFIFTILLEMAQVEVAAECYFPFVTTIRHISSAEPPISQSPQHRDDQARLRWEAHFLQMLLHTLSSQVARIRLETDMDEGDEENLGRKPLPTDDRDEVSLGG